MPFTYFPILFLAPKSLTDLRSSNLPLFGTRRHFLGTRSLHRPPQNVSHFSDSSSSKIVGKASLTKNSHTEVQEEAGWQDFSQEKELMPSLRTHESCVRGVEWGGLTDHSPWLPDLKV